MSKQFDTSWQGWVDENIQRGCNKEEILGILLKSGFALSDIQKAMGKHFPAQSPLAEPQGPKSGIDYEAIAAAPIISIAAPVDNEKLQLYTLENFLTHKECDEIIALTNSALRPSAISMDDPDKYFRTSSTCFLSQFNSPIVEALDEKIARTLGIRLPYSEGIQAQKYLVGQEFKPHTDYFEPGLPEYTKYASVMGQRTWTFMVYLNDNVRGGGTKFTAIDQTFYPKKGMAVIWNSLYADGTPNHDTKHWGMPVEEGEKIVITKWFREKGSGPMFYEQV